MSRTLLTVAAVLGASVAHAQTWSPPAGIPAPSFGIVQTAGPFTHYVDNTHPLATDTANPFGTPLVPRRTVPTVLVAGSVVEVRGGPYIVGGSGLTVTASGTALLPVFIRGIGLPSFRAPNPTCASESLTVQGSYYVVEGIRLDACLTVELQGHHGVLRNCDVSEVTPQSGNDTAVFTDGADMVIFRNQIHDNGPNPLPPVERDIHGFKAGSPATRVWFVDNECGWNAGDCVQISDEVSDEPWPRFIYLGRNRATGGGGENAVDIKQARDVIISENEAAGFRVPPSGSSDGAAMIVHYQADRVWFLFNRVHHSELGIRGSSGVAEAYTLGNLVHDIRHTTTPWDPDSCFHEGTAIHFRGSSGPLTVADNTIVRADSGIAFHQAGRVTGNIISALRADTWAACFDVGGVTFARSVLDTTAPVVGGSCTGCVSASPLLDGQYVPQAGSPAVGLQTQEAAYARFQSLYGLDIRRDLFGKPRPGAAWTAGMAEPGGPAPVATNFYTVSPCRLVDTRNPPGPSGGPVLRAYTGRAFPVTGLCNVPATAVAVAVNLTAASPTHTGHFRLYPDGGTLPIASALNFVGGRTRANNAVLRLGVGGRLAVWCEMAASATGSSHFVLDVTGYFQ